MVLWGPRRMAAVPTFSPIFCQFGVTTSGLWNQLPSNLVLALSLCWSSKIARDSVVQVLPQEVTVLLLLFPSTGKRAPMHQQDLVAFIPSLEQGNQTLPEEAYTFTLPFWVQKAPFKWKYFHSVLTASDRVLRPCWEYFSSHNWSTVGPCSF